MKKITGKREMLAALVENSKHYADILDNCLFPSRGDKTLLTLSQIVWSEKIKAWKTQNDTLISSIKSTTKEK